MLYSGISVACGATRALWARPRGSEGGEGMEGMGGGGGHMKHIYSTYMGMLHGWGVGQNDAKSVFLGGCWIFSVLSVGLLLKRRSPPILDAENSKVKVLT